MSLTVHAHEVLHLGLRDPFRIARTDHASDDGVTTVIVELRDDRFPDVVGVGEGYPDRFYGETPETMAAIFPYLLSLRGRLRASSLDDSRRPRRQLESRRPDLGGRPALERRRQVRPRHRPPRLRRQGPRHPGPRAARPAGRHPADRLHDRHRRAGDRRPASRPGRRLPGAQDQVRRPAGPRDAPGRPRGLHRPDPGRRQHRLDPRRRRAAAARDRRPRRRADRAAVPGTRLSRPRLAPGAVVDPDRGRRERGHRGGPRRARRRRRRGQREARQVRRDRPAKAMLERGARARLQDVPRLHGGDVGRDRGVGGRRVARRLGRPRRLPAARRRPVRGPRAGRRPPLDPDPTARSRASPCGPPDRRPRSYRTGVR